MDNPVIQETGNTGHKIQKKDKPSKLHNTKNLKVTQNPP